MVSRCRASAGSDRARRRRGKLAHTRRCRALRRPWPNRRWAVGRRRCWPGGRPVRRIRPSTPTARKASPHPTVPRAASAMAEPAMGTTQAGHRAVEAVTAATAIAAVAAGSAGAAAPEQRGGLTPRAALPPPTQAGHRAVEAVTAATAIAAVAAGSAGAAAPEQPNDLAYVGASSANIEPRQEPWAVILPASRPTCLHPDCRSRAPAHAPNDLAYVGASSANIEPRQEPWAVILPASRPTCLHGKPGLAGSCGVRPNRCSPRRSAGWSDAVAARYGFVLERRSDSDHHGKPGLAGSCGVRPNRCSPRRSAGWSDAVAARYAAETPGRLATAERAAMAETAAPVVTAIPEPLPAAAAAAATAEPVAPAETPGRLATAERAAMAETAAPVVTAIPEPLPAADESPAPDAGHPRCGEHDAFYQTDRQGSPSIRRAWWPTPAPHNYTPTNRRPPTRGTPGAASTTRFTKLTDKGRRRFGEQRRACSRAATPPPCRALSWRPNQDLTAQMMAAAAGGLRVKPGRAVSAGRVRGPRHLRHAAR